MNLRMFAWGELMFADGGITARSAWGEFAVPSDVYARSLRLDRRYPNNYAGGYLDAWCRRQWELQ